jgi:hypothetical protein
VHSLRYRELKICPAYVIEINMCPAYIVERNEIYYAQYILDKSQRFLNNCTAEGKFVKTVTQSLHFYANANSHRRA